MQSDEYIDRFGLTAAELKSHILEYGKVTNASYLQSRLTYPITYCFPSLNSTLPFADFSFDLALCPDYLFADEEYQNIEFHLQQIIELCRVAKEVRIFPLGEVDGVPSPLLGPVLLGLQQDNYGIEIKDVTTPLHPDGSAMLRVWAQQCHVG